MLNWKFYTSICAPGPSEFLAQVALSASDTLIRRNIEQIQGNTHLAKELFDRLGDPFHFRPPKAGSTALVQIKGVPVSDLAHKMAEEAGILIQPAEMLGAGPDFFRIGLGRATFPRALEEFERFITTTGFK